MDAMGSPLIVTTGLSRRYGDDPSAAPVLADIDLEIESGRFTVIMGSSGAGKSTLLYCLSGMDRISGGSVRFLDHELATLGEDELAVLRRSEIGFVFQQINLLPRLTLWENVTVAGYLDRRAAAADVHERALALLRRFGLEDLAHRLPGQVSGGEQQRVAVARALINSPAVVFADEPTGALNSRSGRAVLDLLTEANREGQSVLMVTHDVRAALRGDRIIYLADGRVRDELELSAYAEAAERAREGQILTWLTRQGW
jgi:putative ABC transport system ATP-binding protein